MWMGPIQDPVFAKRVLNGIEGQEAAYGTWPRMNGMLRLAEQVCNIRLFRFRRIRADSTKELPDPFFFTTNKIHGFAHSSSMPSHKMM
jgi:tRNA (guanine26-N2/guanine27-N2)-dimethyltransferase